MAKEKGKLVRSLGKGQTAVLNHSDNGLRQLSGKLKCDILWYGDGSDLYVTDVKQTDKLETVFSLNYGKIKKVVQIPFVGKHFVQDALAASGAALALGIPVESIADGLGSTEKPAHRMARIVSSKGYIIIDDAYNANPLADQRDFGNFQIFKGGRQKDIRFWGNERTRKPGR